MTERLRSLKSGSLALLVGPVAVLAATLALTGTLSTQRMVTGGLLDLVLVVGIYVFVGLTGVFSFGQLAFTAVGAYAVGLLTVAPGTKRVLFKAMPAWLVEIVAPYPLALLAGAVLAALFAAVIAVPLSRMSGLSAALATLAVLVAVHTVAGNWEAVTNGPRGIPSVPSATTWVVALGAAVLVVAAVWVFQQSALGLRLRAGREDDVAARALGIRVGWDRGVAFVLSAVIMGLGGGLYAGMQGLVAPDAFFLAPTFMLIAMLVVGGMTSLSGAVVGAVGVLVLREVLRAVEDVLDRPGLTEVGVAVVLLVVLARRPRGVTSGRELDAHALWRRLRARRRRTGHDSDPVAAGSIPTFEHP